MKRIAAWVAVILTILLAAGCGEDAAADTSPPDAGPRDAAPLDAAADAPSDAPADAPADAAPDASLCDSPLTACGDACVNIDEDAAHCGACDAACGPFERCIAGACELDCELGSCPAIALSVGGISSCVIQADHTVWCWGNNATGQLGDGTTTGRPGPVQVAGITTATSVSVGLFHACALLADTTAVCWGANTHGQLGDGSTTDRVTPTPVPGLSNVVAIEAGGIALAGNPFSQTVALTRDGVVYRWGASGERDGTGTVTLRDLTTPLPFAGTRARAISVGGFHACLVSRDDTVSCWGTNFSGQLSDLDPSAIAPADGPLVDGELPSYITRPTPRLTTGAGIEDMSLSTTRSCTVQTRDVGCVGAFFREGLLDLGSRVGILSTPAGTSTAIPTAIPSGLAASGVAAGLLHTCTLDGGAVSCAGNNDFEQLGTPEAVPSDALVPVLAVTDAVTIGAGLLHSCALTASGEVQCWGSNQFNQLRTGAFAPSPSP